MLIFIISNEDKEIAHMKTHIGRECNYYKYKNLEKKKERKKTAPITSFSLRCWFPSLRESSYVDCDKLNASGPVKRQYQVIGSDTVLIYDIYMAKSAWSTINSTYRRINI